MIQPIHKEDIRRGALLILGAALCFSLMSAAVKSLSGALSTEIVVFFRNFFSLLLFSPWLMARRKKVTTPCFHLHMVRAVSGLCAMYFFFFAIQRLALAEAVLLNFTLPLFMPFFAWFWLGEPVHQRIRWALAVGFVGIILILKPGAGVFNPVSFVGLTAGVCAAFAQVSVRRLALTEPTERIVFYFLLLSTVISAVPTIWKWQVPDSHQWLVLVVVGAFGALGQVCLSRGYAFATAARLGPFLYSTALIAGLLDWLLWGQLPDLMFIAGAVLVFLGGVLSLRRYRERIRILSISHPIPD